MELSDGQTLLFIGQNLLIRDTWMAIWISNRTVTGRGFLGTLLWIRIHHLREHQMAAFVSIPDQNISS